MHLFKKYFFNYYNVSIKYELTFLNVYAVGDKKNILFIFIYFIINFLNKIWIIFIVKNSAKNWEY